jgi:hypothetical protein
MSAGVRECARAYPQGCGESARTHIGAALAQTSVDDLDDLDDTDDMGDLP